MNKFLFFLSSFVAIVVTRADPQYPAYYYQDVYPNPYTDLPLAPNPYLGNNPNNRLFWNLWTTTTTTSTSTSTTTCTVSTNLACPGRRKRFVEFLVGEDDNIEPTLVQKVEVTEAAKMDQLVRKEREANPQLVSYRHLYFPFQPQPTFASHYYPTYPKMYNRQQIVAGYPADSRLFFRITATSTVTTTSTTTSRSTPGCSTSSNFNPC